MCLHSLETRESRTLCVFLVNTCLNLDSRWNLCFTLIITAYVRWEIRHNLMIFFISFPVKGTCEGVFLLKLQAVFTNCNFAKDELLLRFFFWTFDKKCWTITFRWPLLFIAFTQVVFREKVLLKLSHLMGTDYWRKM